MKITISNTSDRAGLCCRTFDSIEGALQYMRWYPDLTVRYALHDFRGECSYRLRITRSSEECASKTPGYQGVRRISDLTIWTHNNADVMIRVPKSKIAPARRE